MQGDPNTIPHPQTLKRSIGLTMLVLYGLGVTVGAGIYVLVGAAAARAGALSPIAFLIAALVMALSAASFAELSQRLPVAAGEAAYVAAGFGSRTLAVVVGLLVAAAGIVSAAAISRGASGYIGVFIAADPTLITAVVLVAMGAIAAYGISEAVGIAAVMTLIELSGLAVIVAAGLWRDPFVLTRMSEVTAAVQAPDAWHGIVSASVLAFFAFIGFEGMVNIAEEVTEPRRTLPRAIALTMLISTVLYILVVWIAIHAVPRAELAAAPAPLSLVFARLTGAPPGIISAVAVFATINGIIAQIVMASRVLYGMARQGALPAAIGRVDTTTRSPLVATAIVVALALVLAIALPIEHLAEWATRVMLAIFVLVDAALVAIKRREGPAPGTLAVPIAVPAAGAASAFLLMIASF